MVTLKSIFYTVKNQKYLFIAHHCPFFLSFILLALYNCFKITYLAELPCDFRKEKVIQCHCLNLLEPGSP